MSLNMEADSERIDASDDKTKLLDQSLNELRNMMIKYQNNEKIQIEDSPR